VNSDEFKCRFLSENFSGNLQENPSEAVAAIGYAGFKDRDTASNIAATFKLFDCSL